MASMDDRFKFPQNIPTKSSKVIKIGNFRLGKTIGIGSFGKVKIAEHVITGHKVAIKILNRKKIKSLRMDMKIRREISNMKLFMHPHIIRLYEVIETPTDIFMIMEYVPGGELFDYIVSHGKLLEDDARRFFQQIISGVEYCHSHMVVHRDLKPENLLIDKKNQRVKIADFGLSTMMHDGDFLKTSCGSPNYAAPEVISGKLYAGPEVDVWSCGVILYTLLCARLPFDDEYIPSLFKKIRAGVFDVPQHVSQSCRDLISAMLVVDSMKRITIAEIRQHPWFQVNLPQYLMYPSEPSGKHIENVDEDIVKEIAAKFVVDRQTVLDALQSCERGGQMNEFAVAYGLIHDFKKIYTGEKAPLTASQLAQFSTSPPINLREETPFDFDEEEKNVTYGVDKNQQSLASVPAKLALSNPLGLSKSSSIGSTSADATIAKKKMWYLGILSSSTPQEIMQEVFRCLKVTGFEWKIITPFQIRCRTLNVDNKRPVKIALQLYKVKEKRYLLDIKKLEGETFPFFDQCTKILNELQL
eukprot:TRINITY_DN6652_c0_g1_i1.p1 TRINITY_DN6652_c0_g1~~TRINITY_DN6652_c0_g1_i1.p1  ORF type:complete len:527 (+),score=127.40 TRINITY_DN6652_c0_g1_i1:65-1645(+)